MRLIQVNKREFLTFCKTSQLDNFFQTKEYAEIKRKEGFHTYFVGLEDSGRLRAAAMLISCEFTITRKRIFFCPRGYIIDYNNQKLLELFTKEIYNYVKDKKGALIKINPNLMYKELDKDGKLVVGGMNNSKCVDNLIKLGYKKIDDSETINPNYLYTIDLHSKNNDELFSEIDEDIRENIKRNETIGITSKLLNRNEIDRFITILKNSNNRIDFFKKKVNSYKNIISILSNHNMVDVIALELDIDKYLEVAKLSIDNAVGDNELYNKMQEQLNYVYDLQYKYGHKVLVGVLLGVIYNKKYLTLSIASADIFKNFDPTSSLIWESIKYAKKRGSDKYILYGMENDLESDNNLLNYYKKFNGKPVQLIGEFDFVINNFYYQKYLKKQEKIKNKLTKK